MENCLVTKLKGVVDNDYLLKIGEVRLRTTSATNTVNVRMTKTANATIVSGNGSFKGNGEKSISIPANNIFDIGTTGNGDVVSIDDKYSIDFVGGSNWIIDLSDLQYSQSMVMVDAAVTYGDIINVKDLPLTTFISSADNVGDISAFEGKALSQFSAGVNLTGDVSSLLASPFNGGKGVSIINNNQITGNLIDCLNGKSIRTGYFQNHNLEGGKLTGNVDLANFKVTGSSLFINGHIGITGTLEGLCVGLLNAGQNTTLDIDARATAVTLHAQEVSLVYSVEFATNSILIKNGGATVASYNGSTWSYS